MASVYGSEAGLSVPQISIFIASIYTGGLLLQYPIGWVSDRVDRRLLIVVVAAISAAASFGAMILGGSFTALLVMAFAIGGMTNPLYALLIAYTNDYLEYEDMAAASGGLIFINGLGAIAGPLVTGWIMGLMGPQGFFLFLTLLMLAMVLYGGYRMTQRPAPSVDDTGSYAPILAGATPVAVEVAQEVFIETAQEDEDEGQPVTGG